jgi:hypothetical protein
MTERCVGHRVRVDVGYGLDEVFVGLLAGCRAGADGGIQSVVDSAPEGEHGGSEGREEAMDLWIVRSVESCIRPSGIIVSSVALLPRPVGIV